MYYNLPLKFSLPSSSSAALPSFATPQTNPEPSPTIIFPSALPTLSLPPKASVTVRSPCLLVVRVLEFSDRGISQIGSQPDVSNRKSSLSGNHVGDSKRKGGHQELGIGIGHVRRHMTCQKVKEDHVICHVTCLRVSEDYTSRDATWN